MGYYEESLKPRSEKITLVTAEAVERLKIFTANGGDWDKPVSNFVVGVKDDGFSLIEGVDWIFTPEMLELKMIGGVDPRFRNISVTYRFFFSTTPINLPYDLIDGATVEWNPIISSIGTIGQQLDDENTGIVLESSSTVSFINSSKFFDNIFDTLIWENQNIYFYSWFPNIPIEEKEKLFEGLIESKSYSDTSVGFKVKDFVYKLKNYLNLGVFSESDGVFLPSLLNTPKRRIYGQADYVKCASLDAILDGYNISGSVTGILEAETITGVGTNFLDEVSPQDEMFIIVNNQSYKIGVQSVDSATQITINTKLPVSFLELSAKVKSNKPWRKKNRRWSIAGHKLRSPAVEILIVNSSNTFFVSSVNDFKAGDEILVNNIQTNIRRISGNKIITTSNISPLPVIGQYIQKRPIKSVFLDSSAFVYQRDYLEENTILGANLVFNELAEFSVSEQRKIETSFTFINGSRVLTTSATVDLRSFISSRDWIRSSNIARDQWYEILDVSEQTITLRSPVVITGGPITETIFYKNLVLMDETSLVTVNCLGMEVENTWIRTASDAVRHLLINDAEFKGVNEPSFLKAKSDSNYTLSMVIPLSLGGTTPLVRDVISDINSSVFGSLYGSSSVDISFSILNGNRPELTSIIRDDDLTSVSLSVSTNQKIVNKVIINYRPFTDIYTGTDASKTVSFVSKFVNDLVGINNTNERLVYLYEDEAAIAISQRIAFFNSLSASSVVLKSKMIFAKTSVNDKIYIELDRLYSRYAGKDSRKLGIVTSVKKDGNNTEIVVNDLGNLFNRVPSICPDDSLDYSNSSADDKIKWGYILDNDTLTPDILTEIGLGSGIIG